MLERFVENQDLQPLDYPHFPTRFQAVIWRNWGFVSAERLACVLKASVGQVLKTAENLGLKPLSGIDPKWLLRGYITIIRANWHLLPYSQLLELLGWTKEQLAFTLQEDDFLWAKMGQLKPSVKQVHYRELTPVEKARTRQLLETLQRYFPAREIAESEKPFDFLDDLGQTDPTPFDNGGRNADEIAIDEGWEVEYPGGNRNVERYVEQFTTRHMRDWNIRLIKKTVPAMNAETSSSPHTIKLQVRSMSGKPKETHHIEASPNGIIVTSVDNEGLLRALQWLSDEMKRRGGPFIKTGSTERTTRFDLRFIYSYFAVYGDPLLDPELDPYPDALLLRLSELGVNGIWLQSVLYNLVPWEEWPELSNGWERRVEGLRRLVGSAADYGIGVYLYYNEPRSMPLPFFDKRPEWKGHTSNDHAALCTSHPEVQRYLKEGTARLFREVPGLAGLFTITMSENLTNCYSRAFHGKTNCPRCSTRPVYEVVAEVNRLIVEGAVSVNPHAKVICWTWGWKPYLGWSGDDIIRGIGLLPEGASVMCTSEEGKPTRTAGVDGAVIDYSISVVGPSDISVNAWQEASRRGLPSAAKVQFNNTWECSAVPYLPVFDLIRDHIEALSESGVSGLMLSWTLGGYPSLNLELASEYYWIASPDPRPGIEGLLRRKFGSRAVSSIYRASKAFSRSFQHFPFHVSVLYTAPQNYGPANPLFLSPTGYKATMVGFPYDDLDTWRAIYPADRFAGQFRKLSEGWLKGVELLSEAGKEVDSDFRYEFDRLLQVARAAYCHFRSTYLQVDFVMQRNRWLRAKSANERERRRQRLLAILDEEMELACMLHELVRSNSCIGYEASNHYYYTVQDLREKVLNCVHVREQLSGVDNHA